MASEEEIDELELNGFYYATIVVDLKNGGTLKQGFYRIPGR